MGTLVSSDGDLQGVGPRLVVFCGEGRGNGGVLFGSGGLDLPGTTALSVAPSRLLAVGAAATVAPSVKTPPQCQGWGWCPHLSCRRCQ